MMKGLLYKEFLLARANLISTIVIQLLASIVCIAGALLGATGIDLVVVLVLSYCMPFFFFGTLDDVFFRQDEKRPWCNFASSLPQTAKGQVACKYYVMLIVNLTLLFGCFLTDWIVVGISGDVASSAISAGIIIFCLGLIMNAIDIPFMIRFGSGSGMNVKMAVFVGMMLIIGMYALFGDISYFMEKDIMEAILMFLKSSDAVWILALIPYIAVVAYYLSYRISLKLYQKGAENYEQ